jgi:hypothetical protein
VLAADVRQAVQLAQAALAIQLEGSYKPEQLLPGEGRWEGGVEQFAMQMGW